MRVLSCLDNYETPRKIKRTPKFTPFSFSGLRKNMTDRKITYALNKIYAAKEQGFFIEALVRSYQLNVDIIRYILSVAAPHHDIAGKKMRALVKIFLSEMSE